MLRNVSGLGKRFSFAYKQQFFIFNRSFCSNNKGFQTKIEPVTLSYNLYENEKATAYASPIIIMHGIAKRLWFTINCQNSK